MAVSIILYDWPKTQRKAKPLALGQFSRQNLRGSQINLDFADSNGFLPVFVFRFSQGRCYRLVPGRVLHNSLFQRSYSSPIESEAVQVIADPSLLPLTSSVLICISAAEQSVDPFPSDYAGQSRISAQVINDPYPHYDSVEWKSKSKGPYQPCIGPQGRLLSRKDEDMMMSGFRWNTSGAQGNISGVDGELIIRD